MFWRLTLKTTQLEAESLSKVLEPHVLAVSWYELPKQETVWMVEATVDQEPDDTFFQSVIDAAADLKGIPSCKVNVEQLPEQDWLETTWRRFPPLTIGDFYIYGSHVHEASVDNLENCHKVPNHLIGLEINAATAFGSGEHETTRGCLMALCDLRKKHTFRRILDMGCGSGILSLAAAKLWSVPVVAADNDPESARVTEGNAYLNECHDFIFPYVSSGFDNPDITSEGPYDLITANILAKPLCEMAVDMVSHLMPSGIIILSGLLDSQVEPVLAAYVKAGAKKADKKIINEWATLVLIKE